MREKRASDTKHARIRETIYILSLFLPLKYFHSKFRGLLCVLRYCIVLYFFKISDSETLAKREFTPAILFLFGLPLFTR